MASGQEYTTCPHCAVNNVPGRAQCWRCGTELPIEIGPDGQPRAAGPGRNDRLSREELEALLAQAQTVAAEPLRRRLLFQKRPKPDAAPVAQEGGDPPALVEALPVSAAKHWMLRWKKGQPQI